uniref:Nucleolar protein 14 n=1 Tax=Mesocestoides corti TaxID=53468 RepID=A0A5K3F0X0_MESCO
MAKGNVQPSKLTKSMKSKQKCGILKAKHNSRERILSKQLEDFGKVGGIIDKRVGVKGSMTTSTDAALRRHIIEKLRQMESLGTISADKDDPLVKASMGNQKSNVHASFDDDLGGLSAEIVESELFAGGLLKAVEPDAKISRQSTQDALLQKIALTKEQRLKRVEENEANRQKLKDADAEWADKVRFMLAKLNDLKPKSTKASEKMAEGRTEVLRLLNKLSSAKSVVPVGVKVGTESIKSDQLLANLESIVSRKVESTFSEEVLSRRTFDEPKTEDIVLRLLCRIGAYEPVIVSQIADELLHLQLATLSNVVRGLFLAQIVLVDVISLKVEGSGARNAKFANSGRLNGIFIPELPQFLLRLINTACTKGGVLYVAEDMSSVDNSTYATLDIDIATKGRTISEVEVPTYRLACLNKCLELTIWILNIYAAHFPAPTVCQIFSGLATDRLNVNYLPVGIAKKAELINEKVAGLKTQPQPREIFTADKVSLLLANKCATPQDLQKVGLVPQLEPQFDEKLDVRKTKKKKPANVELRQKLAKEKRGVIRELRRDARFLANYDRKKTKARYTATVHQWVVVRSGSESFP